MKTTDQMFFDMNRENMMYGLIECITEVYIHGFTFYSTKGIIADFTKSL